MIKKILFLLITIALLVLVVIYLNTNPAMPIGLSYFEQQLMNNVLITHEVSSGTDTNPDSEAETDTDSEPDPDAPPVLELFFSHTDHFYSSAIDVSITASIPGAVIYYTLDGSDPTTESDVYREPISLRAKTKVRNIGVYPLKAIAVLGDEITRPLVHSYFVSDNIDEEFDVLVVSLSTNPEYLFNYDTGILVAGVTRSDYIRDNPGKHIDPPAPANFNWRGRESERPIYVEMFEADGSRVIAQAAGVRVHGGWSRAESQKSLRLIARREYEPTAGKFKYDFYPDDVRPDALNTPITAYDQLVLSNNANDRNFAMLRQEVNYALAQKAGLRVTPSSRAAAVFLNGIYYGFVWMNTGMNDQYLEDLYNAPVRDFQIVENSEKVVDTEDPDELEAIEYFNSFYDKDFSDPAVLAEFEAIADLDNLLLYYAYQTFVGNRDWPNNNMKRWRYVGPQPAEDEPPLADELDGRWRYITYDLDFLMSLYEGSVNASNPSFREYLNPRSERYSYMLTALFENPDIVDRYALYICDIAANIVTVDNVSEQIDRLYAEAYSEISHALSGGKYANWVSHRSVQDNHDAMIKYVEKRADSFMGGMRGYFGWDDDMFDVQVSGSAAIIGTLQADSSRYFAHLSVPLYPVLSDRYSVFEYWELNGKIIETPELIVTASDAVDGVVKVRLVTSIRVPDIVISDAYGGAPRDNSVRNGAVLHNTTDNSISTKGLYLTDSVFDPMQWSIPAASIPPGGTLGFAGRSSNDNDDIGSIRMSFNVRENRVLYLFDEDGNLLDWRRVNE